MATQTQLTVNDVLQIISDLRGESSINTDAVRIRAVDRANKDFARRMYWRFYRLDDQTSVGDATNDYTVGDATNPMRMKGLTEVFVSATADDYLTLESERHAIVDYNTFKNLYNQSNASKLVYEWFDAANDAWKMHINPAPAATDTITYSFYWQPPTKTATGDEVICPNNKILALLALAEILDGEDEDSDDEKNEAEMLINEIIGKENAPSVNQAYSMDAVENSITPRGIGTY